MNKLKNLLLIFMLPLFLVGCNTNLNNTPTKQAEIFLGKYQTLHSDVLSDLDKVIAEEINFTKDQRDKYRSIMKMHYQELEYDVKDERVDGDKATVIVEIEVDDYSKVLDNSAKKLLDSPDEFNDDSGVYDHNKFVEYQLDQMKNTKDKVKYTLELTFTLKDKKWVINKLSKTEMDKLNGVYKY